MMIMSPTRDLPDHGELYTHTHTHTHTQARAYARIIDINSCLFSKPYLVTPILTMTASS